MITDRRPHITRAGCASSDEGQSCKPQRTNAEFQGSCKTKLQRSGILRHDRLGTRPYLGSSGDRGHVRRWTQRSHHYIYRWLQLPWISLPHKSWGKTREASDRGCESCLKTEIARWLNPCTNLFWTTDAKVQIETWRLSLHRVTVVTFKSRDTLISQALDCINRVLRWIPQLDAHLLILF